jgi:hypothetical protein
MNISELICRKCKQNVFDAALRGAYLARINKKGVRGIVECRPGCGDNPAAGPDDALLQALEQNSCPQCSSDTGVKYPRNDIAYCEDCGWPDEDFDEAQEAGE